MIKNNQNRLKSDIKGKEKRLSITIYEASMFMLLALAILYICYLTINKLDPYRLSNDLVNEISYLQQSYEQKTFFPDSFVCSNESFVTRPVLLYWIWYSLTNNFIFSYQLTNICSFLAELAVLGYLLQAMNMKKTVRLLVLFMFVAILPVELKKVNFWPSNAYANFTICTFLTLGLRQSVINKTNMENFNTGGGT